MDTLITIIGLTSFAYLFIFAVKAIQVHRERARYRASLSTTIYAQMQVRLCEYEGVACRIFCSTEHNFTHIYAPKRFSQETAEAIIGNETDLMTESIYFHLSTREEYYRPKLAIDSIDATVSYAYFLRLHDGSYMNIWGFDS